MRPTREAKHNAINKVGYSTLAGVLSLAYASESNPRYAGFYFVGAFIVVFVLIWVLEVVQAIKQENATRRAGQR